MLHSTVLASKSSAIIANIYSVVFTLNRKVQVSHFGAALCWESKQFSLYSLNADEWTDGMNRHSVMSTLSFHNVLHHTHTDKERKKVVAAEVLDNVQ